MKTKEVKKTTRAGVKGGKAVVKKFGRDYMAEIGSKGGKKSWRNRKKAMKELAKVKSKIQ